jgi:ABC-type nickel/cobalt efflux system permease component RcnA
MRLASIGLVVLSVLWPVFGPSPRGASAHPLGNFTINRYTRIELYRDAVDLHYVLDIAEIPTYQLITQTIDTDGDSTASVDELAAYRADLASALPKSFTLTVDGRPLTVRTVSSDSQLLPGQGGLDVLRITVAYRATPASAGASSEVQFVDHNYGDRIGWKEIVVQPSPGAVATIDASLTHDTSDALRNYPQDALKSAPDVSTATFSWQPGTGSEAPGTVALAQASDNRTVTGLGSLLAHRQSLAVILASLAAALGFGMLHALGPGHGKTVVAAYLVGSRGTMRHAFALGLTVTATHTSMVYLLGFITIAASAFIVPERLYLYLGLASGLGVIAMGIVLFATRVRGLRRRTAEGEHRHGVFGRPHSHAPTAPLEHEHDHHHEDAHHHAHGHDGATPQPSDEAPRITWRGLFTLGVIGGLLPCPSALLVMLAAISLGQVFYGMLLIVAFSLGLAGVLTGIGISLVLGKRLSRFVPAARAMERPAFARVITVMPAVSALGIAAAGFLMTLQAMQQFGI